MVIDWALVWTIMMALTLMMPVYFLTGVILGYIWITLCAIAKALVGYPKF